MFNNKMKSNLMVSEEGIATYQFEYDNLGKGLSRKIRRTTIEIHDNKVKLFEKLTRPFRKTKELETEITVENINRIISKKTIYWYDIFWIVMSFLIGFVNPLGFLGVAIFLYFGIRTVLIIKTVKGDHKILIKGNNSDVEDLINCLRAKNPEIIIKI
ncbi:MAG: hypothetical protein JXR88_17945 [Clostridia bacterium]|nr:hypothetical protein [Clostridia bacterium]